MSFGGMRGEFKDRDGDECQVVRDEDVLLIGMVSHEMALNRKQAAELSKLLARFAETGELGEEE